MKKINFIPESVTSLLSERIEALYQENFQHSLKEMSFYSFDKAFIIVIEGTVTQPERLLNDNSKKQLVKQVRSVLDALIQPQLRTLLADVMKVEIVDWLSDTTIETDRTCAIAIFEIKPTVLSKKAQVKEPASALGDGE